VSDDDWTENINERNQLIQAGASRGYYVDEGLMKKLQSLFEEPGRDEVNVWYTNRREGKTNLTHENHRDRRSDH
jgi:hypothetical protein